MMNKDDIARYRPLIDRIAGKYRGHGTPREDLIREGLLGLEEAETRYDPKRDTNFVTYAAYWINFHIRDFLEKKN